jgi:hypothetical protein
METTHTFAGNDWIVLNVGGHRFETSLQTLTWVPNTFLASLFSGRYEARTNDDGAYCIDRDGMATSSLRYFSFQRHLSRLAV